LKGETSKTITILVAGDTLVEANENFAVALSNPSQGSSISTASATGTIQNDDKYQISIAPLDAVKAEGDSGTTAYTFTVSRTGGTSDQVTVHYAVTGTYGLDAADFGGALPSGTVTFLPGESSETLTINVAGDSIVEANENFTVSLSNPSSNAQVVAAAASATGTIQNDDAAPGVALDAVLVRQIYLNDGTGLFADAGTLDSGQYDVALGDLDGDGDTDAFVTNFSSPNRVYLNDGAGVFTNSGQSLGNDPSVGVALGDLDGDGDLDAFVANFHGSATAGQPNRVYLNNGAGVFTDSGQSLGNDSSQDLALGDLDGDGDLDAFVANEGPNRIYLNDGNGTFTDSGQALGSEQSQRVALGDLDGDGDTDAFVTNFSDQPNRVYLNDGAGVFTDSGQSLGNDSSIGVAVGDLDADGDLDAFVANFNGQPNRVYLNDGDGVFTDSGQSLGNDSSAGVALGDLDADGDLDAFVANPLEPSIVYMNNGSGVFTESEQALGSGWAVDLGLLG
jgi:FG-GAP-like repeat/Calx-beta domain